MVTHPIVLIPGLAGSRLKTHNKKQSPENGVTGGKLWVSQDMAPPPGQKSEKVDEQTEVEYPPSNIVGLNAPAYDVKADQPTEDPVVANWKYNLKLKDNGITPQVETEPNPPLTEDDPEIQFNRFVDGVDGIRNLAVSQGELNILKSLGSNLLISKEKREKYQQLYATLLRVNYFSELITALLDTDEYRGEAAALPANLVALPYDWRIAPTGLEQRYQYFSNLKSTIEDLYKAKPLIGKLRETPVVIIAHSMGNRMTQYFLEWIKNDPSAGQAWIDKHIERYIAVSPPWIGAPLAIRLLSTDEGFTLGGAKLSGIKNVLQSCSSIASLLPITKEQYQYFSTEGNFSFLRKEGVGESPTINPDDFTSETIEATLTLGGAENTTLKYVNDYYKNDPNFSDGEFGSKAVTAPPVKNIDVIYSTGFDSPVGAYYYKEGEELKVATYLGTPEQPVDEGNFVVIEGVRYERGGKTQQVISHDGITNSGDGVVAYGSLAYFRTWQPNPDVQSQAITGHPFVKTQPTEEQAKLGIDFSHNAILRHPDVIAKIFSLLGVSKATPISVRA
ncbi:MAG: hypothetical protein RM338_05840 [Nostoc sp. DedQUE12a]|nr:hypothetical protein [Nostoc sp. DedQUE12a]